MQAVLTKQYILYHNQQQPECVVTEDIATLGLSAKLKCIPSLQKKNHMNEVVEVTFDALDKPHESGVLESIITEDMHKLHMEEVVQLKYDEQEARRYDVGL